MLLNLKIRCECSECNCKEKFEFVKTEDLLNLIQHGRLEQEQIAFLKSRVESRICKRCSVGTHQ